MLYEGRGGVIRGRGGVMREGWCHEGGVMSYEGGVGWCRVGNHLDAC